MEEILAIVTVDPKNCKFIILKSCFPPLGLHYRVSKMCKNFLLWKIQNRKKIAKFYACKYFMFCSIIFLESVHIIYTRISRKDCCMGGFGTQSLGNPLLLYSSVCSLICVCVWGGGGVRVCGLSPTCGTEHFGFPSSAPRLGNQRPWYVQPRLCDWAYKRSRATYRKEKGIVSRWSVSS